MFSALCSLPWRHSRRILFARDIYWSHRRAKIPILCIAQPHIPSRILKCQTPFPRKVCRFYSFHFIRLKKPGRAGARCGWWPARPASSVSTLSRERSGSSYYSTKVTKKYNIKFPHTFAKETAFPGFELNAPSRTPMYPYFPHTVLYCMALCLISGFSLTGLFLIACNSGDFPRDFCNNRFDFFSRLRG